MREQIKREFGNFDEVEFLFRYRQISFQQKTEIQKQFENLEVSIDVSEVENDDFVIILSDFGKVNPLDVNHLNERLGLARESFGLFVTVTSNYDHCGITFPMVVLDWISIVGGQVDVSVIAALETS